MDTYAVDAVADMSDPWTEFALTIFRLNGLIMLAGEGISSSVGQSSARWQVLGRVSEAKTVAEIAREVGYARQSVQRVADALAREGLISFRVHPTDNRTKLLELTPRGLQVLTALHERQSAWSWQVMTALDQAQLQAVTTALKAIEDALEPTVAKDPSGAVAEVQKPIREDRPCRKGQK